ncbi:MAG: hypothetical protein LBS90_06605 [Oscillospiraceae bacterium]|jgi:hypothetical protein|nr:hypothetical protein [Oscillospiraceae bacterium]
MKNKSLSFLLAAEAAVFGLLIFILGLGVNGSDAAKLAKTLNDELGEYFGDYLGISAGKIGSPGTGCIVIGLIIFVLGAAYCVLQTLGILGGKSGGSVPPKSSDW